MAAVSCSKSMYMVHKDEADYDRDNEYILSGYR